MTIVAPVGAQVRAVESDAELLMVLAPPGCGKTEVLAMRAAHLLRSGAVEDGRKVLALTFTNRARDNLRHRLVRQLGEQRMRSRVTVANFHEISARLLDAHHRLVGLEPGYQFPRPAWTRSTMMAITSNRDRASRAFEVLSLLKREPYTDAEIEEGLESEGESVALAFERKRKEERFLDYGDLPRYAQLILRNSRAAALFQSHFRAVLVDEFQDLSLQQYEIAQALCARKATFVGDPYQGIFTWAGAQPTEVHADLRSRADEVVDLDVSFRSSPAVLDVVNAVSSSLGCAALTAVDPDAWSKGGHAYAAAYASDVEEADGIVSLTDDLASRFPQDTIGVICRAAYRRGALDRAYERARHHPQFWDISLDTPRVARLLKLHARHVDIEQDFVDQVAELRSRVSDSLQRSDIDTLKEVSDACDQLMDYAGDDVTVRTLMSRLRDHTVVASIAPGVHVLNAHVGKGQQFDWVVVMGLEEGHVPGGRSVTVAAIEEEQRVLLVMLSRARKGLFLTHATSNTNQWGKTFSNSESRWWEKIESACKAMPRSIAKLMKVT
ncbi:UvrD-helicase domain-containing protein [Microbacterium sp. RU33B]|uniref:UvrD-helicase domain-containing protein n=1 Tax=Microbacterium sp. RU33B TaxID=1907390 RepID=UPI00095ED67A|nr:ATP-dependent helicase [Microbacterium sp. RU33B]SIT72511.1 DNA helicase-2 / ATP-dependent DNA helicase PcrA [Microbacterium sp. RU33B]